MSRKRKPTQAEWEAERRRYEEWRRRMAISRCEKELAELESSEFRAALWHLSLPTIEDLIARRPKLT